MNYNDTYYSKNMKAIILGAGISGVSLAHYLQKNKKIKEIIIVEKNREPGGLMRSFNCKGILYDVGPHIIFSKYKNILKKNISLLKKNISTIKRSNKIIFKSRLIKYPFENELYKLPKEDLEYCLNSFLNNPFENYNYNNMIQFFLKNFGEGITRTYLEPYNRKIWKFDPSFMDTQMVDRIPKPPREDILKSSKGINTEGYKHQLYFQYPVKNGIQSLFDVYINTLNKKNKIFLNQKIKKINRDKNKFLIHTQKNCFKGDLLFSTIPLNEFCEIYENVPDNILTTSKKLLYNSIIISLVNVKGHKGGDNFAFMIPDKNIIFHRISKLDFLGKNYSKKNSTSFLVEITFREGDQISKLKNDEIFKKIISGLIKLKFCSSNKDVNFYEIRKFKYAYVIYDLFHRINVDKILKFFKKKNIHNAGRCGSWEYLNSDQVIHQSRKIITNVLRKI